MSLAPNTFSSNFLLANWVPLAPTASNFDPSAHVWEIQKILNFMINRIFYQKKLSICYDVFQFFLYITVYSIFNIKYDAVNVDFNFVLKENLKKRK